MCAHRVRGYYRLPGGWTSATQDPTDGSDAALGLGIGCPEWRSLGPSLVGLPPAELRSDRPGACVQAALEARAPLPACLRRLFGVWVDLVLGHARDYGGRF
jgi:hypothetical protein